MFFIISLGRSFDHPMGLAGFYGLIQKQEQYIPTMVTLEDLRGKTIALDGDFFMYKAMHGSTTGDAFVASDIGRRIVTWLTLAQTAGIHSIFVTTGGTVPIEKVNHCEVNRKRKRNQQQVRIDELESQLVTSGSTAGDEVVLRDRICRMKDGIRRVRRPMSTAVVKYIQDRGFDCRVAVSEADFLLVLLSEDGTCDYVATEDADIIVSGAHHVIRDLVPLLLDASPTARVFCRSDILTQLQLTGDQFVQLGVLLSCDYQPPLKNVGPVTALRMIREHGTVDKFLGSVDFHQMTKAKKRKYDTPASMSVEDYVTCSQRSVEIMTSRPDRAIVKISTDQK
jgi:5'-3' exonuclease